MSKKILLTLSAEVFWLIITALFASLALLPIINIIEYKYLIINGLLAVLFILYFRYALLGDKIVYLRVFIVQAALFLLNIFLFITIINRLQEMVYLLDNYSISTITRPEGFSGDQINKAYHFYKNEFLFLSVGCLVVVATFELRLLSYLVMQLKKIP